MHAKSSQPVVNLVEGIGQMERLQRYCSRSLLCNGDCKMHAAQQAIRSIFDGTAAICRLRDMHADARVLPFEKLEHVSKLGGA